MFERSPLPAVPCSGHLACLVLPECELNGIAVSAGGVGASAVLVHPASTASTTAMSIAAAADEVRLSGRPTAGSSAC